MIGARRMGIKAKFVGGTGAADPAKWRELSNGLSDGMISPIPFWPKSDRPMVKKFTEKYMEEYKEIRIGGFKARNQRLSCCRFY